MNILLVEDDLDYAERILRARLENNGANSVLHAQTADDARNALESGLIEYVILDLAIPLDSAEGSPNVEHGQLLASHIRRDFPGTPVLILTGQSSEAAFDLLEDDDSFAHFWDGCRKNIVKKKKKRDLDEALILIKGASEQLSQLGKL